MSGNNDTVYLINGSTLTNIANAIRTKTGKSGSLYPSEMDEEITSITTGYQPITVNITQSEHQTITANSKPNLNVTNGKIVCPDSITINASITADDGYTPGTLNQTSVIANWGDTVSFSASPAELISEGHLEWSFTEVSTGPYGLYDEIRLEVTYTAVDGQVFANNKKFYVLVDGETYHYNFVSLNEGQSQTITLPYKIVYESDLLAGQIIFPIYDDSSVLCASTTINNFEELNGHLTIDANISGPYTFDFNEPVGINIILTNDGNLTITNINLHSEETGDDWGPFDSLVPGESKNLSASYNFTETDISTGHVTITFTANGKSPDPDNPDVDVTNDEIDIIPQKSNITISSGSDEKTYDGTPLTSNTYSIDGTLYTNDRIRTVQCTGSQTDVGSSLNTIGLIEISRSGIFTNNPNAYYNITYNYGLLTVNKAPIPL